VIFILCSCAVYVYYDPLSPTLNDLQSEDVSDEICGDCRIPDWSCSSSGLQPSWQLTRGGEGGDVSEGKMNHTPVIEDLWNNKSLANPTRAKERYLKYGFEETQIIKDSSLKITNMSASTKVISSKRRSNLLQYNSTLENPEPEVISKEALPDPGRSWGVSKENMKKILVGATVVYGAYCYFSGKPILPQIWNNLEPNQNIVQQNIQ
jgi:hypothetical protein